MQQEIYIYATGKNMEIIRFQQDLRQEKTKKAFSCSTSDIPLC